MKLRERPQVPVACSACGKHLSGREYILMWYWVRHHHNPEGGRCWGAGFGDHTPLDPGLAEKQRTLHAELAEKYRASL